MSATITGPFTIEDQAVVGRRAQIRARASSEGTATLAVSVKVGGMTKSTTASLRAFVPDDAKVTIGGCNTVPMDSTVRASVTLKGKGESLSGGNAPDYLTTTGLVLLPAATTPSPSALYRTASSPGVATVATTLGSSSVTLRVYDPRDTTMKVNVQPDVAVGQVVYGYVNFELDGLRVCVAPSEEAEVSIDTPTVCSLDVTTSVTQKVTSAHQFTLRRITTGECTGNVTFGAQSVPFSTR